MSRISTSLSRPQNNDSALLDRLSVDHVGERRASATLRAVNAAKAQRLSELEQEVKTAAEQQAAEVLLLADELQCQQSDLAFDVELLSQRVGRARLRREVYVDLEAANARLAAEIEALMDSTGREGLARAAEAHRMKLEARVVARRLENTFRGMVAEMGDRFYGQALETLDAAEKDTLAAKHQLQRELSMQERGVHRLLAAAIVQERELAAAHRRTGENRGDRSALIADLSACHEERLKLEAEISDLRDTIEAAGAECLALGERYGDGDYNSRRLCFGDGWSAGPGGLFGFERGTSGGGGGGGGGGRSGSIGSVGSTVSGGAGTHRRRRRRRSSGGRSWNDNIGSGSDAEARRHASNHANGGGSGNVSRAGSERSPCGRRSGGGERDGGTTQRESYSADGGSSAGRSPRRRGTGGSEADEGIGGGDDGTGSCSAGFDGGRIGAAVHAAEREVQRLEEVLHSFRAQESAWKQRAHAALALARAAASRHRLSGSSSAPAELFGGSMPAAAVYAAAAATLKPSVVAQAAAGVAAAAVQGRRSSVGGGGNDSLRRRISRMVVEWDREDRRQHGPTFGWQPADSPASSSVVEAFVLPLLPAKDASVSRSGVDGSDVGSAGGGCAGGGSTGGDGDAGSGYDRGEKRRSGSASSFGMSPATAAERHQQHSCPISALAMGRATSLPELRAALRREAAAMSAMSPKRLRKMHEAALLQRSRQGALRRRRLPGPLTAGPPCLLAAAAQ